MLVIGDFKLPNVFWPDIGDFSAEIGSDSSSLVIGELATTLSSSNESI